MRTVFLSSTYKDLAIYRQKVIECIDRLDEYDCNCMERSGARDSDPASFCLEGVAKCDLFIGILGLLYGSCPHDDEVSLTEKEYNEAVRLRKPRLMFVTPSSFTIPDDLKESDEKHEKQAAFRKRIDQESNRASFSSPDELAVLVSVGIHNWALNEVICRRKDRIEELRSASRARCIRRWMAPGMPEEDAIALADDPSLSTPGAWFLEHADKPQLILVGEIGAGKSLIAERLFQAELTRYTLDPKSPIPVYLTESDLKTAVGRLEHIVKEACEGLGDPTVQGTSLILDGLDEVGPDSAIALLNGALDLRFQWPFTRMVATSRPLPVFSPEREDVVPIPELQEQDALDLIGRVASDEVDSWYISNLPTPVRDAVRFPLFAILLGTFLKGERRAHTPQSTAEMIAYVVDRALRGASVDAREAYELLMKLACKVVDSGGNIPASEIGTPARVQPLLASRLVTERLGTLAFALPIFAEWFAALALEAKHITVDEVLVEKLRLERWRYPLIILTGTGNADTVSDALSPVARAYPAIASGLVQEGMTQRASASSLPSNMECGQRLRTAMSHWVAGIGSLAGLVAPVMGDGNLCPIAVETHGDWLEVGWCYGDDVEDDVIAPGSLRELPASAGIRRIKGAAPNGQAAWAWRWTLDELTREIGNLLKRRGLPFEDGPLFREFAWKMARDLGTLTSSGMERSIPISQLEDQVWDAEEMLAEYGEREDTIVHLGYTGYDHHLVKRITQMLRCTGLDAIRDPWPGCDMVPQGGGTVAWSWSFYSPIRLLERIQAIFEAAIQSYEQLADQWFSSFTSDLRTYSLLPIRIVGMLSPAQPALGWSGSPSLYWYMEPLPRGTSSRVDIEYSELWPNTRDTFELVRASIERYRPECHWPSVRVHTALPDIFGYMPATDLAYEWLWDDLADIHWVEGSFPRHL